MLARVAIVGSAGSVDHLTYAVPPHLLGQLVPGHRVLVPIRSRRLTAIVTETGCNLDGGGAAPRPILELLEPQPLFDRPHLQLIEFLASYYMAPIGEAFRNVIPALGRVESQRLIQLQANPHALALASFTPVEKAIVEALGQRAMTVRQLERIGDRREIGGALARLMNERWVRFRQGERGRHRERSLPMVRVSANCDPLRLRGPMQRAVAALLSSEAPEGLRIDDIEERLPGAKGVLRAMARRGFVEFGAANHATVTTKLGHETSTDNSQVRSEMAIEPGPDSADLPAPMKHNLSQGWELTSEQAAALMPTTTAVLARRFETFLLWGVTGSGKSEVYVRLAAEALAAGRQVLVLVPEIALADQLVGSFNQRFSALVGIAHSAQNVTERWASWMAALSGDIRIVIGPRSAIFAPINDLGLIVVDEEHDAAYKQEEGIRYNARDLAVALGRLSNCPVVLGSATPSIESFANARNGRYRLLRLIRRVQERQLAHVEIIDLRQQARDDPNAASAQEANGCNADARPFQAGNDAEAGPADAIPLSSPLIGAMRDNLAERGQSLVFLNRRGYHNFLQCHLCGSVITCRNCSVSMTFHLRGRMLRCHYCGASEAAPDKCFECGGFGLEGQGFGTEQLVQALARRLPSARIERMDSDTSRRRGARRVVLQAVGRGEVDILVGTQMITKGFDFPGVTLVAVVLADMGLHMPDFRSAERTFQSLTQVAGRAGRGERPGRVLIQTYAPHHYSIRAARDQDYARFVRRELELRRELMYPPFARMALVRIEGENSAAVRQTAERIGAQLARTAKPESLRVLGPAPAPIERIKQRYRWQVMVKGERRDELRAALATIREAVATPGAPGVRVSIDIDPVNML
jgi:primosomal protein N' (replication factor Y) (superfamily II helicase)